MTDKEYHDYCVNKIRDAAKTIFDNANDYVGNSPGFFNVKITIKLQKDYNPMVLCERTNVIPDELNREKDLSDPYFEDAKNKNKIC